VSVIGRGIGLGRVLGIPVRLDLSWFAGLALFTTLSRELWAPVTGAAAGERAATRADPLARWAERG
jgi:hypothetical protein